MNERKYFYVRPGSQTPAGPHTLTELQRMLQMGDLAGTTKVARGGDSEWANLADLLKKHTANSDTDELPPIPAAVTLPPVPWISPNIQVPETAGPCPNCRTEIPLNGQTVIPEQCPHCGFILRASKPESLWQQFIVAMKKSFVLRGRATRMEYWGLYLFSCIITWCLSIPAYIIQLASMTPEEYILYSDSAEMYTDAGYWSSAAGLAQIFAYAVSLIFVIPTISAMVRRFHDIGKSGWWVIVLYGLMISPLLIGFCLDSLGYPISTVLFCIFIFFMTVIILSILVLVWLCTDSQKGRNAYGASPKYPWL